jgi:hypothetical protein
VKKKAKKAKVKARKPVRKAKPKKAAKSKKSAKGKKPAKAKKSKKKGAAGKPKMSVIPPANSVLLGRVEDFYAHINVVALTLQKPLRVGDKIHILGHTTNLEQTVDSMQINHQSVTEAKIKDAIGIKVKSRVRRRDYVFAIKG